VTLLKTPTLTLADVEQALRCHSFHPKVEIGSHRHWEGVVDGARRIVSIEQADAPFSYGSRVLAAIIRTSGIPRRLFYKAAGKPLPWGIL